MTNTTKTMKAKFYTNTERYMGSCKLNDSTYFELRSWLLSGNYIIVDSQKISTVKELDEIIMKYTLNEIEEIEEKRQKILEILNENDVDNRYLTLTNNLYRSKPISRYHLILNLQIMLGCSQKQSREIAALFV